MADDADRRRVRPVIVRRDGPAGTRRRAENMVVVARREEPRRDFRPAVDDHVHAADRRACKKVGESAIVGDELAVHRIGERRLDLTSAGVAPNEAVPEDVGPHLIRSRIPETDERVRIADRHLPEQHPVDRAEQSGVRSDAEGERHQNDHGPTLCVEQHAHGEPNVPQHARNLSHHRGGVNRVRQRLLTRQPHFCNIRCVY